MKKFTFLFLFTACLIAGCADSGTSVVENDNTTEPVSVETGSKGTAETADFSTGAWADDTTVPTSLKIGDVAPSVRTSQWVLGDQLDGFMKDQVTVVEFWATWCPPCRSSMPHLSMLSERYRGEVNFIGVTKEDLDTVNGFLEKKYEKDDTQTWNDVIKYNLVIDDSAQHTSNAYMAAAKQNGIPCAFIVGKDGHVEWIGHPMQMDDPLEKIVKGDWDREAAVKAMEEEARQQEAMQTAFQEMRKAQMDEDWDAALAAMDKLGELTGQDIRAGKLPLLAKAGKIADAKAILEELKTDSWDDAMGLNQLAWGLATEFPEELRDLDLALEMSTRSNELTDNGEANMLDTLARVYYEKGDLDKAIDWQMKAVAAAPVADELQATLDQYKAEKESPAEEEEESSSEESDAEEGSEETAEDKGDKEDK